MVHWTKTAVLTAVATLLASTALAHPGDDLLAEVAYRQGYHKQSRRSLSQCSEALKARSIEQRAIARRNALAESLRQERGLDHDKYLKRDLATVLATDHESNNTSINLSTPESVLFSGNNSCMLVPEVTQGPYYAQGELIRNNLTETQPGIPLYLDVQVIDVATCLPVPEVYIDFWQCNATGVYSGIVGDGNGNANDLANINTTFLRGLWPTDSDGAVQIYTIFPGYYTNRATHNHAVTHLNGTVLPNGTYTGGTVMNVAQLFFDQDLISEVEATYPYNTNTDVFTENTDDFVLVGETANSDVDPMVEYIFLGDDISDGILGWIAMAVDTSSNYTVSPNVCYYATGGVDNPNFTFVGENGTIWSRYNFTAGEPSSSVSLDSAVPTSVEEEIPDMLLG